MIPAFKDQLQGEEFEFFFGKHWLLLVAKSIMLLFILFCIASGSILLHKYMLANVNSFSTIVLIILSALSITLFIVHKFFLWFISYAMTFIIVTSVRIIVIKKSVFLVSEKEVLDLVQIRDIQMKKKGFWGNILEYGDINLVLSAQGEDTTVLKDVPHPAEIQERCNIIRHVRLQESGKRPSGIPVPQVTNISPHHESPSAETRFSQGTTETPSQTNSEHSINPS